MYYYSLIAGDKEYCIEPLIGDKFYLAVYDLNKFPLIPKQLLGAEEARYKVSELEELTGKQFKQIAI